MKISVVEPLAISQEKMNQISKVFNSRDIEIEFFGSRDMRPMEIIKRCQGAEVVVIGNLPFPAEVIEALPDLKLLAVAFTGLDHVDMKACRSRKISVCNASGYSTINVAELALGLIIDLLRNITRLDPVTRAGGTKDGFTGYDLGGKTVGIVGLGAIGQRLAKLLQGFDCRILALDRGKPVPSGLNVELCSMERLLHESDILSLHCPLNDTTRGLIGRSEFKKMKPSAFLVNCARGPVVDQDALADALSTGLIAGAGLDVFETEPPLDKDQLPLLKMDNVILTPHIAYATAEAFVRRADIVVDNIVSWLDGAPKNIKS